MAMLIDPGESTREDLERYVKRGGYLGLARAVRDGPSAVLAAVERAGLRGRGGSGLGEPVARKWREAAAVPGTTKFVIANGAESHPESRKDHLLMTRYPHRILEGLLIAGVAVRARQCFVYVKETYNDALASIKEAIAEGLAAGAWAGLEMEITVFEAPASPAAGEESAVIDAIEGFNPPRPRLRPPSVTSVGLYGRPTVVNNVETLAAAAAVMRTGEPAGTVLVTLTGDVRRPGVYEVPLGTPLRAIVEDWGGGAPGPLLCVLPGGSASGPLGPAELELPLDYDALWRAGTSLGPAVLSVVAGAGRKPGDPFQDAARLWTSGSCGQCRLCQEGTAELLDAAQRIVQGANSAREDMELWALRLRGKGNCLYATMVARSAARWLRVFGNELSG
ncbi:MAG: SLBB domain-containing protein [Firmicutes bacterium]|nr:SLBB domain-containing protein [Bacillota bacterium]